MFDTLNRSEQTISGFLVSWCEKFDQKQLISDVCNFRYDSLATTTCTDLYNEQPGRDETEHHVTVTKALQN